MITIYEALQRRMRELIAENLEMRSALRAILTEAEETPPGEADPFTVAIQNIARGALIQTKGDTHEA